MQLVAKRYGLVPVRPLPGQHRSVANPPPRQPLVQNIRENNQAVRVQNFSYDNAVTFLHLSQPEMAHRHQHQQCASCVERVALHPVQQASGRTRTCCQGGNPWNLCPGLARFPLMIRSLYVEACHECIKLTRQRMDNQRRPVCHSLHVLPRPVPVAPPVIHEPDNKMPILLVTAEYVHEDRLISPHVTYVHTDEARDQLHTSAQHRYSCVEVAPEDARTVLSEFSRAIFASPLDTTVSIALPHKHAYKPTWWP